MNTYNYIYRENIRIQTENGLRKVYKTINHNIDLQ